MCLPLITFKDVSLARAGNPILEHLSFSIRDGGHLIITGGAGSGKTALLSAICGTFLPVFGSITFPQSEGEGRVAPKNYCALAGGKYRYRDRANMEAGFYQQRYNAAFADDSPTVEEYLRDAAAGLSPGFWDLGSVCGLLNLNALRGENVIKLSNGESRRLLIAAALLKNPKILALDSPLTGLDIKSRENFHKILEAVAASGITVVMTSDGDDIPKIFATVLLLKAGCATLIPLSDFTPDIRQNALEIDRTELQDLIKNFPITRENPVLKMANVNVKYGDRQILHHISWEVLAGERWALTGPNGSGKTTLLSLAVADNPQAYANDIVLFGRQRGSGETIWEIKKKIGFVSAELYQYFPQNMTCAKVVESGFYDTLGIFRKPEPAFEGLSVRWLALAGIKDFAEKPFRDVSAATQRLCLLLRALVKNPPLLVLDEPFQNLEKSKIAELKNFINGICENSPTSLIFVSHYAEEIPECVTRQIELKDGRRVR